MSTCVKVSIIYSTAGKSFDLLLAGHTSTFIHSQAEKRLFKEWASIRRHLDLGPDCLEGCYLGAPVTRQSLLRYHRLTHLHRTTFQDWVINGLQNLTSKADTHMVLGCLRLDPFASRSFSVHSQTACEVLNGLEAEKLGYNEFVMLDNDFKG